MSPAHRSRRAAWSLPRLALLVGLAALARATPAPAHETDQYTVPFGKQFAELGPYMNRIAYETIEEAVNSTNARIRNAQSRGGRELERLRSPDVLAAAVFSSFTSAYFIIEDLEALANSKRAARQYGGQVIGYEEQFQNIYAKVHFALDPRQFFRIWHSSTLKMYDTYLGSDKIGHFTDMGYNYYKPYRKALARGLSEEEAVAVAVRVGTDGLIFAESGMVGYLSAGAYSNADLASNYAGFKFYVNLTEPTRVKGRMRPPMVEMVDGEWRIAPHVGPDSDFFAIFVSDHLNEALNPSLFEKGMRDAVTKAVHDRCSRLMEWYRDDNGACRTRSYFDEKLESFRLYYGEPYGYRGEYDELVSIGRTCFEMLADDQPSDARTCRGLTRLHVAASTGDVVAATRLLDAGVDVDERIRSDETYSSEWGNTALHLAAANGHTAMVNLLIARGAEISASNDEGVTPLHRAIAHPDVVSLLLRRGAAVNVADERGRTPLHWAVRYPEARTLQALLAGGADVGATDHAGQMPLHRAAMYGQTAALEQLVAHGADVNARADFGATALHFAARGKDPDSVAQLVNRRNVDLTDDFGWTALHDASARGNIQTVQAMLDGGADVAVRDVYGSTPLHQAARRGHPRITEILLRAGADANARTVLGSTPLHEAAFAGRTAVARVLLEHGADPHLADEDGRRPRQLATQRRHREVAAVLRDAQVAISR